jgi:hypothetical protein
MGSFSTEAKSPLTPCAESQAIPRVAQPGDYRSSPGRHTNRCRMLRISPDELESTGRPCRELGYSSVAGDSRPSRQPRSCLSRLIASSSRATREMNTRSFTGQGTSTRVNWTYSRRSSIQRTTADSDRLLIHFRRAIRVENDAQHEVDGGVDDPFRLEGEQGQTFSLHLPGADALVVSRRHPIGF